MARILLVATGFVLLAAGTVGAVIVGPDDTVVAGETTFSEGTAYTPVDLFGVGNITVTLTAEADDGEVFIGAGHPVDVTDVVSGHDAYRISQVDIGSVTGVADEGEEKVPDPRGIEWFDSVSGTGEQVLAYPVDDMSPQFLIYSPDDTPVTASVGFTVPGAFFVLLGVGAAGLLLLVGSWALRRRPRDSSSAPTADGLRVDTAPDAGPAQDERSGTARRVVAGLGASALLVPVAGCAMVPEQLPDTEPTKVAITVDELDQVWEDYDRRNDAAAQAAAAPDFDEKKWKTADTGPALEDVRYSTRLAKAESKTEDKDEKQGGDVGTTSGEWVSAPEFGSYPMWAIVDQHVDGAENEEPDDDEEKDADEDRSNLALIVRAGADKPWKLRSHVGVPAANLPELPDVAPDPTPEQLATVEDVAEELNAYVSSGKKPELIEDVGELKDVRKRLTSNSADFEWSVGSDLFDDDSIHVVPGDGSVFALIEQMLTLRIDVGGGRWAEPWDAVNGKAGDTLYSKSTASVLVEIPADGKGRVLGIEHGSVIADEQ